MKEEKPMVRKRMNEGFLFFYKYNVKSTHATLFFLVP